MSSIVSKTGEICGTCQQQNQKLLDDATKEASSRKAQKQRSEDFKKGTGSKGKGKK